MARTVLFAAGAPFFSGAERALLLTIQGLDRQRYQPHVIVGTDGEFACQLGLAEIPFTIAEFRNSDKRHPVDWLQSIGRIVAIARRQQAAIVHANEVPTFQPCGYAARLLGIPTVCHVRFLDGSAGFEWFLKPGFTRAIFVSNYLRHYGEQEAPHLFAGKSETIHDGVLWPPQLDSARRTLLRAELGISGDEPTVALVGQIAEVKGIWEFVVAARLLAAKGIAARFVVVGDDLREAGRLRREMEQRIEQLGLSRRFHFTGFRTDASTLIPLFDVVAVPSHVEPLGNATLEAMAAGRPVVGSRIGGIPEMVIDGETGLLVPPKQPDQLAAALEQLLKDRGLRQRLGVAGLDRAKSFFGIERHVARIQAVYDNILGT